MLIYHEFEEEEWKGHFNQAIVKGKIDTDSESVWAQNLGVLSFTDGGARRGNDWLLKSYEERNALQEWALEKEQRLQDPI